MRRGGGMVRRGDGGYAARMARPVILVTGASRGLGRGAAVALAAAGHDLAIHYAGNHAAAAETADLCRAAAADPTQRFVTVAADLAALGRVSADARAATRRKVGAITDMAIEEGGVPARTKVLIIGNAPVWTESLYTAIKRFQARGGTIVVLDAVSMTRKAIRTGEAITIIGQEHADVQALDPIWTVSGAATVFARRGR